MNKQPPKCNNHKALTILFFAIHCYLEGAAENVIYPAGRASSFVQLARFQQGKSQQSALKTYCFALKDPCRTQGTKKKVSALNIVVCWF